MRRVISDIVVCPIARECNNNSCIMRMTRVFGYLLDPSLSTEKKKAQDIEKKFGKGYLPAMDTLFRDGGIQVICKDFKDK